MQQILEHISRQIHNQFATIPPDVKPADYIPELALVDPTLFALALCEAGSGDAVGVGVTEQLFTVQSIGKIVNLLVALEASGIEKVFARVGKEATGDPFYSITRIESSVSGVPYNPFINAGAIAVCSCIPGNARQKEEQILAMYRKLLQRDDIAVTERVYRSELHTGNRNRALAYLMSAKGVFPDPPEEPLIAYLRSCSIQLTCTELARLAALLANHGLTPTGEQLLPKQHVRLVRVLMMTAGMYDYSGRFAADYGFAAKSGVSGGIIGVIPGRMGIAVFSPPLDAYGNSYFGLKALAELGTQLDLFAY